MATALELVLADGLKDAIASFVESTFGVSPVRSLVPKYDRATDGDKVIVCPARTARTKATRASNRVEIGVDVGVFLALANKDEATVEAAFEKVAALASLWDDVDDSLRRVAIAGFNFVGVEIDPLWDADELIGSDAFVSVVRVTFWKEG